MGKFFKYLGIVFLSLILIVVAFTTYSNLTGVDKEKVFIPYIKENIPKLTTWDYAIYKELMVPSQQQTDEQLKLYLKWFTKLGKYESMGEPKFINSNTTFGQEKGKFEYASYSIPLSFDTGEASVTLVLVYHNEKVKIYKINFNSDKLLK